MEAELRASEKERAEHVMLVDLARSDLGRVSRAGTVRVRELMRVGRFSHVMHLTSVVDGELAPGVDALDAFRACFPAGTVSGAPKIRAMERIAELETDRRGPYAGAIGYLGFDVRMDTCIGIRTAVIAQGSRPAACARARGDGAGHADARRLPRASRWSRRVWRMGDPRTGAATRKGVARAARRQGRVRRSPGSDRGDAVPLAHGRRANA